MLNLSKRAILGMLKEDPHDHVLFRLELKELEALTKALGYEVVERFTQTESRRKGHYLIGSGKVDEISEIVSSKDVELVVMYNELTSKQKLNLSVAFNCEVIDRYELTLRIFEEMASDRISKLQIELARTRKLYPFFQLQASAKYSGLERQPSWAGTGEFAFHSKVKGIQKRIGKLKREISSLAEEKMRQVQERRKLGAKIVCIAGYYNAGKTTLFNQLTGENKLVGDRPFKTLSSKYQRLQSNSDDNPLLIDTIGFVIGLNPALIKSFELNLIDMNEADLLLFMLGIDDDPDFLFHKLKFGLHLLKEIGVEISRILIVLNKSDLVDDAAFDKIISKLEPILGQHDWASISAKKRKGVDDLVNKVLTVLKSTSLKKEPIKMVTGTVQEMPVEKVVTDTGDLGSSNNPAATAIDDPVGTSTQDCEGEVDGGEDEEELDKSPPM